MARTNKKVETQEAPVVENDTILHDEASQDQMLIDMALAQGDFVAPEEQTETITQENTSAQETTQQRTNTEQIDSDINEAFNALLDPSIVIAVVDSIIVVLFKVVGKAVGLNVDSNEIALSDEERTLLRPVVKRYLMTLDLKLSPLSALLVSVGMIYATKVPAIIIAAKGGNTELTPKVAKPKRSPRKSTKRGPYNKKKIGIKFTGGE